jgi:hypothetical protein
MKEVPEENLLGYSVRKRPAFHGILALPYAASADADHLKLRLAAVWMELAEVRQ